MFRFATHFSSSGRADEYHNPFQIAVIPEYYRGTTEAVRNGRVRRYGQTIFVNWDDCGYMFDQGEINRLQLARIMKLPLARIPLKYG